MEEMYNQLLRTFDKQITTYNDMLKLANKKTRVVIESKISELDELLKIEQDLILKIADIENKRAEIVNKIAEALKIDKKNLNVTKLIKLIENPLKTELQQKQRLMLDVLDKVKNANELNRKLIQHALEYIEFSINVMTNTSIPNTTYQKQGQANQAKDSINMFDVKT